VVGENKQACWEPWRWGGGLAAASNPLRVSNDRVPSEGRVSFGRGPNESTGVDQRQEPAELIITPEGGRVAGEKS
jgi:hypothetical protein